MLGRVDASAGPSSPVPGCAAMTLRNWGLIGAAAVGLVLTLFVLVQQLDAGKRAKTELRVHRNQAEAAAANGNDAVETLGAQATAEDTIDIVTRGNADAIR